MVLVFRRIEMQKIKGSIKEFKLGQAAHVQTNLLLKKFKVNWLNYQITTMRASLVSESCFLFDMLLSTELNRIAWTSAMLNMVP